MHLPIIQCKRYQQEYVSTEGFSWICVTTTDSEAHISIDIDELYCIRPDNKGA